MDRLNAELVDASQTGDGDRIASLSKDIHKNQLTIEKFYADLEKLYDDKDRTESYYEKKLKTLMPIVSGSDK